MALNATPDLTPKQGQYLAFIYYYTKVVGQAPAEADFQQYFHVSPPSVHNMIVTLDERGLISRERGRGRSIKLVPTAVDSCSPISQSEIGISENKISDCREFGG